VTHHDPWASPTPPLYANYPAPPPAGGGGRDDPVTQVELRKVLTAMWWIVAIQCGFNILMAAMLINIMVNSPSWGL
jgi:hypothetical protein